jgi:hypothetical protein
MNEDLQNLLKPSDQTKRQVLNVLATFIESGYIPFDQASTRPHLAMSSTGSVSIDILPSTFLDPTSDVYQINLLPGPLTLKILPVGGKLAVHVASDRDVTSVTIDTNMAYSAVSDRIRSGLISFLTAHPTSGPNISPVDDKILRRPRVDRLRPDDPLRLLPGHTPEGGDQVGPHHPIFGEPRYDPLGPGNIGEPNYDHQPPGPFGARPSRRPNFPFQ